jgi:hypothetical protein
VGWIFILEICGVPAVEPGGGIDAERRGAQSMGTRMKDCRQFEFGRSGSDAAKATVVNVATLNAPILLVLSEGRQ